MRSPGEAFSDPRVEALRRWLARYQPFITTVVAVLLIAVLLPGRSNSPGSQQASELASGFPGSFVNEGAEDVAAGAPEAVGRAAGGAGAAAQRPPNVLTFEEAVAQGVELVPNCDPATGRIGIPSRFAPPCTQKHVGPNGGATWQGVTDKEITVVYVHGETNPAVQAFLAAAGANDSRQDVEQQVKEWGELYEAHFNTWGRTIKWVHRDASGGATDDEEATADALWIADEAKAFASIGATNNTMVDALVARGVMCFCTVSLPIENYINWSPYVWTSLMASTQGYIHRAEFVNRLKAQKAEWAGDEYNPLQGYRDQERRFGFIYYETADFAYQSGAEFFLQHLKDKYGIVIPRDAVTEYNGYPEIEKSQEQAPAVIGKMTNAYGGKGATSVIFSGDPFGPAFFTNEATKQQYFPEWILTGSALTDTTFFARTYKREQWEHAFGVSYLTARLPEEQSGAYRLYNWHFNKEPSARAGYGLINAPVSQFYNGLHMAGPVLTPETFRAGMYSLPIQGRGGITTIASSYGDKGLWPWQHDPVAADDATEIWWDANERGPDEVGGTNAPGMYRYVDGGKRYLPGEWPTTKPKAFVLEGTVTIYDKPPPEDQWPCYPSPATGQMDRC